MSHLRPAPRNVLPTFGPKGGGTRNFVLHGGGVFTFPGATPKLLTRTRFSILIIYMKKFLDCDWLREMQFFGNTVQKKGNLVQKRGNKRGILIG